MKQYIIVIAMCLACFISGQQVVYGEQQTDTTEIQTEQVSVTNNLEEMLTSLDEIATMSQYDVVYEVRNQSNNQRLARIHLVGDDETGSLMGELEYSTPGLSPRKVMLRFISYDHFQLLYVKQFDFLNQVGFFDQPMFSSEAKEQIKDYKDYYVAVDPKQLRHVQVSPEALLNSLLLVASSPSLSKIDTANVHSIHNTTIVSLSGLEIPEYFLDGVANLRWDYQLNIKGIQTMMNDHPVWQVNTSPKVRVSDQADSLDFVTGIYSEFVRDTEIEDDLASIFARPYIFEQQREVRSTDVTTKLKNVTMILNKKDQRYEIQLDGIAESLRLNLFMPQTAAFKAYNLKIYYTLQPATYSIPEWHALSRLSQGEFDRIVERVLNE